jgi:hypothetical protein
MAKGLPPVLSRQLALYERPEGDFAQAKLRQLLALVHPLTGDPRMYTSTALCSWSVRLGIQHDWKGELFPSLPREKFETQSGMTKHLQNRIVNKKTIPKSQ